MPVLAVRLDPDADEHGTLVDDGRSGSGPFSYELGVKVAVTSPVQLTAIRFYKDSHETGVHVGTVWSSTGSILAQVTFANESASGWQQQALPQSLQLQPGTVYVVSVGLKAYFDLTPSGLATQIVQGPLQSVADGANGVYASAAGLFPTNSDKSSNYFVDVVVGVTAQASALKLAAPPVEVAPAGAPARAMSGAARLSGAMALGES